MKMGEEENKGKDVGLDIKQIATAVARELKTLEKPEEKDKGTEDKFNCPDCGTELKAGVKYCPNCGVELEWED